MSVNTFNVQCGTETNRRRVSYTRVLNTRYNRETLDKQGAVGSHTTGKGRLDYWQLLLEIHLRATTKI